MRKTILMIALIVGASFTTANATENNNESATATTYKVTKTKIKKMNAFCIAISKGEFDVVKKMIEYGENVNKTSNGKTPLMYAARFNRVEIINLLLENGAEVGTKDRIGLTAMDYAKISKATDAEKILESAKK